MFGGKCQCVFVGQSWMKMVSVDVRWSHVACEREVREGVSGLSGRSMQRRCLNT